MEVHLNEREKILNSLSEWSDDWQMHALFCAYDGSENEEFMVEFWKKAVNLVFELCIKGVSAKQEGLSEVFTRKGRRPLALEGVLQELCKRGHFLKASDIKDKAQSAQNVKESWGNWLGKLIWKQEEPQDTRIVSVQKLDSLKKGIFEHTVQEDRKVFLKDEIKKLLIKFHLSEEDLEILFNYLVGEKLAKVSETEIGGKTLTIVKFKVLQNDDLELNSTDSACLSLNLTLKNIENQLKKLEEEKNKTHVKVLEKIRNKDKKSAKNFLIREKLIDSEIEKLTSARNNCEEKLFSISSSSNNLTILQALKEANKAQKDHQINIDELQETLDTAQDLHLRNQEVEEALAAPQDPEEESELLKELESLGEPPRDLLKELDELQVPDAPLPVKRATEQVEFE